jgi:hypothetical protein
VGHVLIGKVKKAYRISVGNFEEQSSLETVNP